MFVLILSIIVGAIIGSFINVIIYRLPRIMAGEKISLSFPVSHCPFCHHPVRWRHNIPLIGWLLLAGKCADCRAAISPRYPLIEGLMAIMFGWVIAHHGPGIESAVILFALCLLVPLACIDAATLLLPDRLTWPLIIGGIVTAWAGVGRVGWQEAGIAAVVGFTLPWALSLLFRVFFQREGMGRGDMKLFAGLGAWMGYGMLCHIMIASSILAILSALIILKVKPGQAFPFGPYPILVAIMVFLFF